MTAESKRRILIIEDEAVVAWELKTRLQKMDWDVVGIAYDSGAIELARQVQPDLLLTDIYLRDGEDGIEVSRAIQAERDVPVVFLTAYSDDETVSRARALAPYGYIIKPVYNRELQIVIDMALYKFEMERELRKTQQLLQTALSCIGKGLVFVDRSGRIKDLNNDAEKIFGTDRKNAINTPWAEVFSLVGSSVIDKIETALTSRDVTKLAPFIISISQQKPKLVDGIVGPMEDEGGVLILRELTEISDPIETLPPTDELLSNVGVEHIIPTESSMCQLLIAPQIESGLALNDEVVQRLNQLLRSTDLVSIYSQSQISVSMPYTLVSEGKLIAEFLLKALHDRFAQQDLNFSIGLAYSQLGDQQPFELFRRASWALKVAQDAGGGRVLVWNEKVEKKPQVAGSDSEKQREYHNLVLLWNVLNVVTKSTGNEEASEKICHHLLRSFGLRRVAVLTFKNNALVSLAGACPGSVPYRGLEDLSLSGHQFLAIGEFFSSASDYLKIEGTHLFRLSADLTEKKLLYLDSALRLSTSDIDFLKKLATYFGAGLARFELSKASYLDVAEEGAVVSVSTRMMSIMESIHLVAPTDATVLIAGESGTGKEFLARAIHENSARKHQPFVIVDCGAVVGSLIESELFGHEKGAFTGADKQFSGRLKEAEGGTILLDEIGDLPLDVQGKLLRFVEDREIVAVGSSQSKVINTRVIAATNRDLKALVNAGDFREDLYYRLNVFAVEAPPLRERKEDILPLANHYLGIYCRKYHKKNLGFTADAEQALLQYGWPGNIRELINVVNKGLILCQDTHISTIHLGLFPSEAKSTPEQHVTNISLESWLKKMVDTCLSSYHELPPLGQWLEEELIKGSLASNSDVLNRTAISLGIPETTLRRKVSRMRQVLDLGQPQRPSHMQSLHAIVSDILNKKDGDDRAMLDFVSEALVKELEERKLNKRDAAQLMGVSLPTYRRMSSFAT